MNKILGIDVGGTKIAAGLVDKNYHVTKVSISPTSHKDLLGQLMHLIESYDQFDAIGLGMPGQVLANGMVLRLPNVKNFKSTNVKKVFEKQFQVPVNVVNDAKAFALAEAIIGVGKGFKAVAGLILGTGVGVGIVIDKKIYTGKDGLAGELEHVTFLDGRMFRDYRHAAGKFKNAQQASKYLKTIVSFVILSFNPEIIVLGGAWANIPGMQKVAAQAATNVGNYINKTPVKISKLKYAGIIGAALTLNQRV